MRSFGLLITVLAVLLLGFVLRPTETPPRAHHADEVQRRFEQAVVMLHARQFEHAVTALHRVLALAPTMPEAHVNMGFALLGLEKTKAARDFFESAIALAPTQANAYYGLALSHEAQGDLALATGAMRSYLHLARDERPEHLKRARAALWEWENKASPIPTSGTAFPPAGKETSPGRLAAAPRGGHSTRPGDPDRVERANAAAPPAAFGNRGVDPGAAEQLK